MRMFYVANMRMPTDRAHGVQVAEMCQAFSKENVELTLVVPRRHTNIKESTFDYYHISPTFKIKSLPVFDLVAQGFWGHLIEVVTFSVSTLIY